LQQPKLLRRLLTCFLLTALLSGCGFALRGSDTISTNFDALVLDLEQPNGEFARLLRRNLDVAGVDVQQGGNSGSLAMLRVTAERVANRAVTVNPQARAAQYELRLSVNISLSQAGQTLIADETLIVERTYFEDIANLAGTRDEVQLITSELRRDLVDQLLRRLAATSIST